MSRDDDPTICRHCGVKMNKWCPPPNSTWGEELQYVCFNDECPYYVNGWRRMMEKYNVNASYRFRYNPQTGETGPLPTWSDEGHRNQIISEEDSPD